jgi:hypothetical protein
MQCFVYTSVSTNGIRKRAFSLQKDIKFEQFIMREQSSYLQLTGRPLILSKEGGFGTCFYFFQHQHLIADLTGAQAYKRFTLFLWMCTLFTIQSIKYLPIFSAGCTLLNLNYLTAAQSWSNRRLAPLQIWTEQAAGRGPYFMHLSEHIAIKGAERLSKGTGVGEGP